MPNPVAGSEADNHYAGWCRRRSRSEQIRDASIEEVPIPWAALPAFIFELVLFLSLATPYPGRIPSTWMPMLIYAGGFVSYLLLPSAEGHLLPLMALVAIPAFWFVLVPRKLVLDLTFVFLIAAVWLSDLFPEIYGTKQFGILGKAMWMRSGILAVLYIAKEKGIGFGFFPTREEWKSGAIHFLYFLPLGLGVAYGMDYLKAPDLRLLQGLGMFAGTLWFVALGEEFFFRGLIQRWIGLPLASILYGLSHLGFRSFPNWKHVALTIILGVFCGLAFRQTKSVRAAMVTHALANGIWVGVFGKF